jgi:hypothetical protein
MISTLFQVDQTIEQQSVYSIINHDLEASYISLSKFGDEFMHVKLYRSTLDTNCKLMLANSTGGHEMDASRATQRMMAMGRDRNGIPRKTRGRGVCKPARVKHIHTSALWVSSRVRPPVCFSRHWN